MGPPTWHWLPLEMPWDDLPGIVAEVCGSRLRKSAGGDAKSKWPEYYREPCRSRVVTTWSAPPYTLTVRNDTYDFSDRGEPPVERHRISARAELGEGVTLTIDFDRYCFEGPTPAMTEIESRWLAILTQRLLRPRWLGVFERDFLGERWLEHPLVPTAWRAPAGRASIGPTYGAISPGGSREGGGYPAVLLAKTETGQFGLLLEPDRALPLGPLPRSSQVSAQRWKHLGRPEALDVPELFSRSIGDPRGATETLRSRARLDQPTTFLSIHYTSLVEDVTYVSWQSGDWILRSQWCGPGMDDGYLHEWALQSAAGDPWAVLGRSSSAPGFDHRLHFSIVGEPTAIGGVDERLRSFFTSGGWVPSEW